MRVPFPFAPESSGQGGSSPARSGPRSSIPYSHLWTDDQGVRHQARCESTEWELKSVGGAAPKWNDKQAKTEATLVFTVQPVGWVGDRYENPAPQCELHGATGPWQVEQPTPLRCGSSG